MAETADLSTLKEPQQVARWHDRIAVSKRMRDTEADKNHWNEFIRELKGQYDVVLGNAYVPPIGEVFAYKDAAVSNLYYKDPFIAVNPMKDATILSAYILEAGVNHLWGELDLKSDIELELTDAILVGHAWNKVGSNAKTAGTGEEMRLVEDSIFANRVSWQDMFMNVGCKRPTRDNIWIGQRIYKPTEDMKKDYGKVAAKLNGMSYPSIDVKYMKNILYKEDFNYSAMYEIWDQRERMIYTIADELTDKYLEDPKPWPGHIKDLKHVFQFLSFHEIPDEPYPQSDIAPWEPQVKEKIKVFTMMLNHVKRWNRQLVIKKNTMTSSELDKFEKGIDGSILMASTNGDIQAAFKTLDFGSLPPDIYMILDRLDAVIRKVNGQPEFFQGGVTKTSTRTEGELQMVSKGADARIDRKQNRIEIHCSNIGKALIAQMKANFNVPYMARITGKEPQEIIQAFISQGKYNPASQTITFTSEDIKGEYDVSVKAGSTLPLDKQSRDAILNKVYQMSVPLASAPSVPPFIAEIVKELLKDYEIKGLEVAFAQQEQDAQQKQQMQAQQAGIEDQKVQAETAKRSAQAQNVQVDTLIKGIQAQGKATGILKPEESLT